MVATSSAHNIMTLLRLKKRDRTTMSPPFHFHDGPQTLPAPPSTCDREEEEYARAVAFLREFHARTTAAAVRATALDAIGEADADGADEALARDFARALSVGGAVHRRRRRPLLPLAPRNGGGGSVDSEQRRREPCARGGAGPPRLRKAAASACLRDLAGAASDDVPRRPRLGLATPPASAGAGDECYSLGRGCDGDGLPPVAKRRRFLFLGDGALPSIPWNDGPAPCRGAG